MSLVWGDSNINVYDTASGTFTFNDSDVEWVYVDWDDGENNTLEKAIFQWSKLDTDAESINLTHTYTKAGTFYPVIRTINSEGFVSKYYYDNSKSSTTTIPSPKQEVKNIGGIVVSDGNPYGTMKIENKIVKSGIDNDIFKEGPKFVYVYIPPIISQGAEVTNQTPTIEITYVEAMYTFKDAADPTAIETDLGYERALRTVTKTLDLNAPPETQGNIGADAGTKIVEILEIKLLDAKIITSTNSVRNDYNKYKFFLIAEGNDGNWYPITYVSNGDPIKKLSDRKITLDFSESRTKASNTSVSKYRLDDGKSFWSPTNQWQASTSATFNDNTIQNESLYQSSYTYYGRPDGLMGNKRNAVTNYLQVAFSGGTMPSSYPSSGDTLTAVRDQFALNNFNQFYDQHHLTRLEASTDDYDSQLDTFKFIYRITPIIRPVGPALWFLASASTAPYMKAPGGTNIYTSGGYYNTSSYPVSVSGWNTQNFVDQAGNARESSEYIVVGNETKFNKIFFNNTNYTRDLMSNFNSGTTGNSINGVFYLATGAAKYGDKWTQTAEWKPLEFVDTTKVTKEIKNGAIGYKEYSDSLSKSGYVEFDMPSDWAKVSVSGLTGGVFNITSGVPDSDAGPAVTAGLAKDITFGFGGSLSTTKSGFHEYVLTDSANALDPYTDDQIGKFNYTFQIKGGTFDGQIFWVTSGNTSTNKIYLLSGNTVPVKLSNTGDWTKGIMRRVNIYDVFDGAVKTGNLAGTIGVANSDKIAGVPYTFMMSSSAMINDMEQNFVDVYPLKLVASGSHFTSGSTPGVEIWDMLPFNNSYSQVVVQKDNTAYDLSYLELTSDVAVAYAGTYYQAISKGGKVFIKRTGTPIGSISFGGNALGDESDFTEFSKDFISATSLRLLKQIEANDVRVMWDEQQKDSTYVRFFGYISNVNETHQVGGKRASKPFSFTFVVESICLIDTDGQLMTDIEPLGGPANVEGYK